MFLGAAFDAGRVVAALPLATAVRVLVHDTGGSHSVLGQLGIKAKLRYVNTAPPIDSANLLPTPGLVLTAVTAGGSSWTAPLGMVRPRGPFPPLPFDEWW